MVAELSIVVTEGTSVSKQTTEPQVKVPLPCYTDTCFPLDQIKLNPRQWQSGTEGDMRGVQSSTFVSSYTNLPF